MYEHVSNLIIEQNTDEVNLVMKYCIIYYRSADKSLAQFDWKKQLKGRHFCPTRRSLLPRRPGWTENLLIFFFLSGLQKLEFGRCSLFPSWSG